MSSERLSPLKIIFLDIDGVLNTARAHIAYGSSKWDPTGVAILDRVCRETGAKLVISSVWRGSMDKWMHAHQLLDAVGLGRHGLCSGHLGMDWNHPDYDKDMHRTPPGHDNPRGEKIQEWIDQWKPDVYAILDDDCDMLDHQAKYFVKTDGHDGITYGSYERLIKILGKKENDSEENPKNEDQLLIPLPVPDDVPDRVESRSEGVWKATFEIEVKGIHAFCEEHAEDIAQERIIQGFFTRACRFKPKATKMTPEEYEESQVPEVFGTEMQEKRKKSGK
ncbi:MAG: hypothetical protein JXR12_06390 [Neptunomonas phycophila]|uniref:HAD domain-containing protein n=1 Tax=Neptunomonas phycophila TaxID=1572645 RepID=UPI003B8C4B8F